MLMLTGTLVPMATTTRPIVNSSMCRMHPTRATMVTIAKLMTAIHTIDMRKDAATTYHLRFSEQLGMLHVKMSTNGNVIRKKIHLNTNLTQPRLPSLRANSMSGGTDRMAGRQGMRTRAASSSMSSESWLD